MRYINIEEIKNYIKKIPYDYVQTHIGNKHNDLIQTTDSGHQYVNWEDIENKHLKIIKTLDVSDRKKYINDNPDWNLLQCIFMEMFGLKCWYSEAPIGNGDFEIDHYRPKNRAKQSDKSKDYNFEHGYWWLAYNWTNYRLSGALANKRRRDRFSITDLVRGKGDIFPLLDKGKLAKEQGSIKGETPMLLDPINKSDPGLLYFDEDGKIYPYGIKEERNRAEESIKYYALDIMQLEIQRQEVWNECKNTIEDANSDWKDDAVSYEVKQIKKDICFDTLRKKSDKKAPFSSVAISCIKTYSRLSDYSDFMNAFNF